MRLTVDIPEEQVQRARALAEHTGRRLEDVVRDALLAMLRGNETRSPSEASCLNRPTRGGLGFVKLHTYRGGSGPAPGIDPTRYASYLEAMDEEHRDPETGTLLHGSN